jgi:hypothetical protein
MPTSQCHRIAPIFNFKAFLVVYPIQSLKTPPKRSYAKIEKDDDDEELRRGGGGEGLTKILHLVNLLKVI